MSYSCGEGPLTTLKKDMTPEMAGAAADDGIRVMLVDDSAVIRGLIRKMVSSDPGIVIAAAVADGAQAVNRLGQRDIDVIVLDIEMPIMDGLTALPKLIEVDPNVKIIMASTLTEKNAVISLKALQAGAADYVPKPTSTSNIVGASDFRRELLAKINVLGRIARRDSGKPLPEPTAPEKSTEAEPKTGAGKSLYEGSVNLRKDSSVLPPKILAIGSSTGGPQALMALLSSLPPKIDVPVVITQHMPATFTALLAKHIEDGTGWTCTEAKDGDILEPNHAYVAPGGFHMEVVNSPVGTKIKTTQNPPENYCRPAVDAMLRSVAKAYGSRVLVTILTGMGADGKKGGEAVTEGGGNIIAQDEKTSVVWGMPGAVATAGLCSAVLPIDTLGAHIMGLMKGH